MDDEHDATEELCLHLVTEKRTEPFMLSMLRDRSPGEWLQVKEACEQAGLSAPAVTPELVATWLPDPFCNPGYVVVIFYDGDTKRSLAAHYNKARLLNANHG